MKNQLAGSEKKQTRNELNKGADAAKSSEKLLKTMSSSTYNFEFNNKGRFTHKNGMNSTQNFNFSKHILSKLFHYRKSFDFKQFKSN